MMGVFVKSMKMPQKCGQCKLYHIEYPMYCMAVEGHRTVGAPYGTPRPNWCPLVEVKEPHGRLGDLDKLKYEIVVGNQKYLGLNEPCLEDVTPIENVDDCIDAIAFAPTIVEAEGSKDEHR